MEYKISAMHYIILCLTALLASGLTFFSGFGLGTLLLPAFSLFFPVEIAVALTAIVHFLNGLFKLFLMGRFADLRILFRFGIPAVAAAIAGAYLLTRLSHNALATYSLMGHEFRILPTKLLIAVLMILFALWEVVPTLEKIEFKSKFLPLGGLLSGFFGGLSGHQGALRSAFLARTGLTKEGFVGTSAVIGTFIDVTRLSVYFSHWKTIPFRENFALISVATLSAFLGAYAGSRFLKKITMKNIQVVVSIGLVLIAFFLAIGIL